MIPLDVITGVTIAFFMRALYRVKPSTDLRNELAQKHTSEVSTKQPVPIEEQHSHVYQ
jgi:hypothetical protein